MKLKNKIYRLILSVGMLTAIILISPTEAYAASDCKTSASPRGGTATNAEIQKCLEDNPLVSKINDVVNFLAAGVGIVITGSIIFGGIQYVIAGNNPQAVTAAKKRITEALIALLAFIFMYAFLQWLIPGGAPLIRL